jgi:putative hydrolase of the HAD superfamily
MNGESTPLDLSSYGNPVYELSVALHKPTWYGFGLDDTLHEFRKASKAAAVEVFNHISSQSQVPVSELATSYSEILTQKTATAFTDGRTSDDYRKERFGALLKKHGIRVDEDHLFLLAALYKEALANSLKTKAEAMSLL